MAVIGERIVLRKRRSAGEPKPHRIKVDKLRPEDELVVEVVTDTKNDVRSWYRFKPADLAGRRSILFRVSGEDVYWLGGVMPQQILGITAIRLAPELEAGQRGRKPKSGPVTTVEPDGRRRKREPKNYKVLVFDASMRLKGIHPSLEDTARLYNLRAEAIDKLCKTKRPSQETGLSFRYWWKVLDFDITDFKLTAARYDGLCKRKPSEAELSGEE
jgi:hypothetical protein